MANTILALDKVFRIRSPDDLLKKLGWEILWLDRSLSERTDGELVEEACFHAVNGAVTAWQLCDWSAHILQEKCGWGAASAATGRNLVGLRSLQAYARERPEMLACYQIANAYKHRRLLEGIFNEAVLTTEEASTDSAFPGWELTVIVDDTQLDARLVLGRAFDFWLLHLELLGVMD
ncbi:MULTISPECIES: hypothetical protein [Stenotrophomonas]|uniref:hypothetical protein n=1 Tax=Stenotrophomonas TaxID=40323 RepID=UPI002589D888|nr:MULTISPECIES: hypothetical protein [Stenotrophomonas]MCR1005755.1 hypothetical protein [Stenotrophomonas maltophilia]MCR1570562.1 hypothetical protein [Stenotrophomonas sp.]